jgi:hypothetical protein
LTRISHVGDDWTIVSSAVMARWLFGHTTLTTVRQSGPIRSTDSRSIASPVTGLSHCIPVAYRCALSRSLRRDLRSPRQYKAPLVFWCHKMRYLFEEHPSTSRPGCVLSSRTAPLAYSCVGQ